MHNNTTHNPSYQPLNASSPLVALQQDDVLSSEDGAIPTGELKEIFVGSIPYIALAGLAGFLLHTCARVFTTTDRVISIDYDSVMAKYPLARQGWPPELINQLQMFSRIHPTWMAPFLEHCEAMRRFSNEMDILVDSAMQLMPSGSLGVNALPDAAMNIASDTISHIEAFFNETSNHGTQFKKTSSLSRNKTEFQRRYECLGNLIAQSNEWLSSSHASRTTMAAMLTELNNIVQLFNEYIKACGPIINLDVNNVSEGGDSQQVLADAAKHTKSKVDLVTYISEYGALPSWHLKKGDGSSVKKTMFVDDDMKSSLLKWWIGMHAGFMPQMYYACRVLGIFSVYNPARLTPSGNSSSANDLSHLSDSLASIDKGHLFSESDLKKLKRPSTSSALSEQVKFWKNRIKAEGWKSVISSPWAGYIPTIEDPCFLPSTLLDVNSVMICAKSFMTITDELTRHMYNQQSKLMYMYVRFRHHWNPDVFKTNDVDSMAARDAEQAKIALAAAKYWQNLGGQ